MFFLASADAQGRPDCSYKGGAPGFVRVTADSELAFPSYDGNGMFRSLGNMLVNAAVALLFIDFESPNRLRVNGRATIVEDEPLFAEFDGAQLVVRVQAERIFANCPRYIHPPRLRSRHPMCHAPATHRRSRNGSRWKCSSTRCRWLPANPEPGRRTQPSRNAITLATMTAVPKARCAPKGSFNTQVPSRAANNTEVSRSAATDATGARVMAHSAMA